MNDEMQDQEQQANEQPTDATTEPESATEEEESKAAQIRRYLSRGYTFAKLTKEMGFDPRTVRREMDKMVPPEDNEAKSEAHDVTFPIVRKTGGGAEVLTPEGMLLRYMGGTPNGEGELRAIMKFRAAMLMVMDLVEIEKGLAEADAKRMEPILRLMKETREEQDAAAARAKASSTGIADRAAQETAVRLMGALDQSNAQVTGSLEQIRQTVSGRNEDPFSSILSMMQSMQQLSQMFGMPLPGMGMLGMQQAPLAADAGTEDGPPPIERRGKEEWQEHGI